MYMYMYMCATIHPRVDPAGAAGPGLGRPTQWGPELGLSEPSGKAPV